MNNGNWFWEDRAGYLIRSVREALGNQATRREVPAHGIVVGSPGSGKGGSCRRCGRYVQAGAARCLVCGEEVS